MAKNLKKCLQEAGCSSLDKKSLGISKKYLFSLYEGIVQPSNMLLQRIAQEKNIDYSYLKSCKDTNPSHQMLWRLFELFSHHSSIDSLLSQKYVCDKKVLLEEDAFVLFDCYAQISPFGPISSAVLSLNNSIAHHYMLSHDLVDDLELFPVYDISSSRPLGSKIHPDFIAKQKDGVLTRSYFSSDALPSYLRGVGTNSSLYKPFYSDKGITRQLSTNYNQIVLAFTRPISEKTLRTLTLNPEYFGLDVDLPITHKPLVVKESVLHQRFDSTQRSYFKPRKLISLTFGSQTNPDDLSVLNVRLFPVPQLQYSIQHNYTTYQPLPITLKLLDALGEKLK
ncbi:MAG: hypothetical protein ACOCQQ_00435 [Candidatus Nanoarchaeia archaeon]